MTYIKMIDNDTNELYHYGVKGMKWGVRRAKKPIMPTTFRQASKKARADGLAARKAARESGQLNGIGAVRKGNKIQRNATKASLKEQKQSSKKSKKPMSTKKKVAIGVAAATAVVASAYGGYKLSKYMKNKRPMLPSTGLVVDRTGNKFKRAAYNTSQRAKGAARNAGRAVKNAPNNAKFTAGKAMNAAKYRYGDAANNLSKNARYAKDTASYYTKNVASKAAENAKYAGDNVRRAARNASGKVKDAAKYRNMKRNGQILSPTGPAVDRTSNKIKRAAYNAVRKRK